MKPTITIEDFTQEGLTVEIEYSFVPGDNTPDWEIIAIDGRKAFPVEVQPIYARMTERDFQRVYDACEE